MNTLNQKRLRTAARILETVSNDLARGVGSATQCECCGLWKHASRDNYHLAVSVGSLAAKTKKLLAEARRG